MIFSDDPEVKSELAANFYDTKYLINYFSSWMKLKTSAACFLGLKQRLKLLRKIGKEIQTCCQHRWKRRRKTKGQQWRKECITSKQQSVSEVCILKIMPRENRQLSSLCKIRGSKIKLPYREPAIMSTKTVNGVLRVGGHLNKAAMRKLNTPIHVSTPILHHIHQQIRHGGRCHMLGHLWKWKAQQQ